MASIPEEPAETGESDVPVLSVRDLGVEFRSPSGPVRVLDGVTFDLMPGETIGVVGESGSGKSTALMAVMGLLNPASIHRIEGQAILEGVDLLDLDPAHLRERRGRDIAMIFQNPFSSLNPVEIVGQQIQEAILVHDAGLSSREAKARAISLLKQVGVPDPEARYGQYPHQFSGGMCQRVVIAMAIANNPKVLLADEPTTALDVSVQAQILDLIRQASKETGAATVLVTHDLGVVAELADRVAVMYAGQLVELAPVAEAFSQPRHPYTAALMACQPTLGRQLQPIAGAPPGSRRIGEGCQFAPRCSIRAGRKRCLSETPKLVGDPRHVSACHFAEEVRLSADVSEPFHVPAGKGATPVLTLSNISKDFLVRGSRPFSMTQIKAVSSVSISIKRGETLGLVGESGSGKSTLAKIVMKLLDVTSGKVELHGVDTTLGSRIELKEFRRRVQMVFQDPYSSLNPRLSAAANVVEPMRVQKVGARSERLAQALKLLERVGIGEDHALRYPGELSGGQRQRVAIARALAVRPEVLVLDEAVSALDVSVQAQVLNLLEDLQQEFGLSYLFVGHDLSVVRQVSDHVAVMYLGRIVELGPVEDVFSKPSHPYTQFLIGSTPSLDLAERGRAKRLPGEIPSPANVPSGCGFRTRCPLANPTCSASIPQLEPVRADSIHSAACHVVSLEASS